MPSSPMFIYCAGGCSIRPAAIGWGDVGSGHRALRTYHQGALCTQLGGDGSLSTPQFLRLSAPAPCSVVDPTDELLPPPPPPVLVLLDSNPRSDHCTPLVWSSVTAFLSVAFDTACTVDASMRRAFPLAQIRGAVPLLHRTRLSFAVLRHATSGESLLFSRSCPHVKAPAEQNSKL
ncbi:uncharacterized protein VTP21DRAFT_5763 [Calcarisporiella thermophila]|uniref:uncharacterized protein n=1 Tax=Calcarisporiella thermophila TaxID=911321 RepID=UPI00374316CD